MIGKCSIGQIIRTTGRTVHLALTDSAPVSRNVWQDKQNSPEYARHMVDRLTRRSEQIASFPQLGGATAYLLSPIDIIPDFIPILGQLDDLVIVPSMIYGALAFIPASVKAECRKKAANQRRSLRLANSPNLKAECWL
jgi:uncharacterized membrane protein YkvA (DUF1232 family)